MRKTVTDAAKVQAVTKAGFRPCHAGNRIRPQHIPTSIGGHHNHWDQVEAKHGKIPAWSKEARDALTKMPDTVRGEIEALIKHAKDKDGNIT